MEEENSIIEEISPDETVNIEGKLSPDHALTIEFIIKKECQEYEELKEEHFQALDVLNRKSLRKEELLEKIRKYEAEQRKRDILISCQSQLNPLIANNEVPCLDRSTIDRFSTKVEQTEKIVNEAEELKQSALKYLEYLEFNIEKSAQVVKELDEKNDLLKKEIHNLSVKRQTDSLKKENLKAEICKIDEEMQLTEDLLQKVTEENKNYLSELECITSKRVKYSLEKNTTKIIMEKFHERIEGLEKEISIFDAKLNKFNKIYKDEEDKIEDCNKETDRILQEIKFIKIDIANKSIESEKLLNDKNAKLLKYNLMLKDTGNEKLAEEIRSKIKEEKNLDKILKQNEDDLNITNKKITQYDSQFQEFMKEGEAQLEDISIFVERIKAKRDEISMNETVLLNLENKLNCEKKAKEENKLASEKLQLDKQNLKITLDGLQKEMLDMESNHRYKCFKILDLIPNEENASMSVADVIKQAQKDMVNMEEESKMYEKELDRDKLQLQGVRAECNLLTDKLAALERQRMLLLEEVERERKRERESTVEKDWDTWSDCSVEGSIPIQVAIRRYKQQLERNLKRKNNE